MEVFVPGLVGSKALSEETMRPVLDKLQDHLIGKNVAADIANKLCDSVATKLEGKVRYCIYFLHLYCWSL